VRLTDRVYIVGSGVLGFSVSHESDCNVYLINGQTEMALIDAGVGLEPHRIFENIVAEGLDVEKLKYVFLTHAHADHAGGCRYWKDNFGITVLGSPETAQFVRGGDEAGISLGFAKAAGIYPADYRFRDCEVGVELCEGDVRRVGDCELRVLETPGHSMGSLSYLMTAGNRTHLFSGDAVFHGGKILLTNVYDCDLQAYIRSIEKLASLLIDTLLPGHLCVAIGDGHAHLKKAAECLPRMMIPPNAL